MSRLSNHYELQLQDILKPEYDKIHGFSCGYAAMSKKGLWGFINTEGKEIVAPIYDLTFPFNGEFATVMKDGFFGAVNVQGQEVFPCLYEAPIEFREGLNVTWLKKSGMYFLVDKNNERVGSQEFSATMPAVSGLIPVKAQGKWGAISVSTGELVAPLIYERFWAYSGFVIVRQKGKWGLIDSNAKEIIPPIYDDIISGGEPSFFVRKGALWGVVKIEDGGQVVTIVPCSLDYEIFAHRSVKEGLLEVARNGLYGFLDLSGDLVVDCIYDEVYSFVNGFACVQRDGLFGIINKQGVEIIPCKYRKTTEFKGGRVWVLDGGQYCILNENGERISNEGFFDLKLPQANGLIPVSRGNIWGAVSMQTGELVLPLIYQDIEVFTRDIFFVKRNGKWGIVDQDGNVLLETIYDELIKYERRALENESSFYIPVRKNKQWQIAKIWS